MPDKNSKWALVRKQREESQRNDLKAEVERVKRVREAAEVVWSQAAPDLFQSYNTFGYWIYVVEDAPTGSPRECLSFLLRKLRAGQLEKAISHQQLQAMVADLIRYFLIENDSDTPVRQELAELSIRALLPGDLYKDPTPIFIPVEARGRPTRGGQAGDDLMMLALNKEIAFIKKNGERISEYALAKAVNVHRDTIKTWRTEEAYKGVIESKLGVQEDGDGPIIEPVTDPIERKKLRKRVTNHEKLVAARVTKALPAKPASASSEKPASASADRPK